MTSLDLSGNAPPDWMNFSHTREVTWADVEAMAQAHRVEIVRNYDLLVAILRGGSPVAALIARYTGLPVDYLVCNRRNPEPHFLDGAQRAPHGRRILLVDDVCGSGWTFERAAAYCQSIGNTVGTLSVYRCAGPVMYCPDFSMEMGASTYLRWPWEYQDETEMPARAPRMAA